MLTRRRTTSIPASPWSSPRNSTSPSRSSFPRPSARSSTGPLSLLTRIGNSNFWQHPANVHHPPTILQFSFHFFVLNISRRLLWSRRLPFSSRGCLEGISFSPFFISPNSLFCKWTTSQDTQWRMKLGGLWWLQIFLPPFIPPHISFFRHIDIAYTDRSSI